MTNPDTDIQEMVRKFHAKFNHPILHEPTMDTPSRGLHRVIMREEYMETENANDRDDLVEFADGLGDLVWTAYASAIGHGIDLNAVLREIAKSNMSKLGVDENGKIAKGPNYQRPDVAGELTRQAREGTYLD